MAAQASDQASPSNAAPASDVPAKKKPKVWQPLQPTSPQLIMQVCTAAGMLDQAV